MVQFDFYRTGGLRVEVAYETALPDTDAFRWAKAHEGFEGKPGQVVYLPSVEGDSVVLAGLGEEGNVDYDDLRKTFFKVARLLREKKENEASIVMPRVEGNCQRKTMMAIAEGFFQADYSFDKRTKDVKEPFELTVHYTPGVPGKEDKMLEGLARVEAIMKGLFLARDLVNETANVIYPETLAQRAKEALEPLGVKVTVYKKAQLEEMGLRAFLSVGQGSDKEPHMIVMEYNGGEEGAPRTALVGKGLTYDSGGYAIKPPAGMLTMHCDMGGAGTVIGTMAALAGVKAKQNVTAVVCAAENLISGSAYKNGDIIGSLDGKTIEIVNTDAEGRVTLADAVCYATRELGCDRIIDLATLTGACVVALGDDYTGALTNDQAFFDEFKKACDAVGEKVWQMPNDPCFAKMNESKVADIKNSGGRSGGMITAGQFVGAFVKEGTPWIHLDIAGSAFLEKPDGYLPERATGVHVRALTELLAGPINC